MLHVFISICLFHMFGLVCIMYLSFNHTLEVMKKYDLELHRKCLEFDSYSYFHKMMALYLTQRKQNVLCFKKICFIGPQNQRFLLEKSCFFRPEIREKGGQTWMRAWYTICSGVNPSVEAIFAVPQSKNSSSAMDKLLIYIRSALIIDMNFGR